MNIIKASLPNLVLLVFCGQLFSQQVLFTDFEADSIGNDPALGGASDIGGPYSPLNGDQSVQPNPEQNGNPSNLVLFGGDLNDNFNQGVLFFDGGVQPLAGMTITYDFYNAGSGGNNGEGCRVALRNPADSANGIFLRNDRDGSILVDGVDQGVSNAGQDTWQRFSVTFVETAPLEYSLEWQLTNLETGVMIQSGVQPGVTNANLSGFASGLFVEIADQNNADNFQGYYDNVSVTAQTLDSGSPYALMTGLDPATAEYDGIVVDDGGTAGGQSGIPAADNGDGFVFNATFKPSDVDLSGLVLIMEIGGTSNGAGLYLADGVPTLICKQDTNDAAVASSLNDTTLPAIAVQSGIGVLNAGEVYTFAAAWDQAGNLHLGVTNGKATINDEFEISGTPGNWSGNDTLSVGIQSNGGSTGGLAGNSNAGDFGIFDVDNVKSFDRAGDICRAIYWNDFAPINAEATPDPTVVVADTAILTGIGDISFSWMSSEVDAAGSVEITSSRPVTFQPQSGDASDGSVVVTIDDGAEFDFIFTFEFKDDQGTTIATRQKLVEGIDLPSRYWLGPEYFTTPLYDWQLRGERMECIFNGPGRRVDLLTNQLQPGSQLEMSVEVMRIGTLFDGFAGFQFAARGDNKTDYRHNAFRPVIATRAGLNTDGTLQLGSVTTNVDFSADEWHRLNLTLTPGGTTTSAILQLIEIGNSNVVASINLEIPNDEILGNLELLSEGSDSGGWGDAVTAFRNWEYSGTNLTGDASQNWGPILFTQHTLSRSKLKLSAQFGPLFDNENRTARLEINDGSGWVEVDTAPIEAVTELALFEVENWDATVDTPYRVAYFFEDTQTDVFYEGTIRRDPVDEEELDLASLTCMIDDNFPNQEIADGLMLLDPDIVTFLGDQYYESEYSFGGVGPKIQSPPDRARLDMLRKWYMWGWSFAEVVRDRPCICILDDHDHWMANIFGSGGQPLVGGINNGGFLMPPEFVNASQRVQTACLPDPFDPTPIQQGIEVYYTDVLYGRVSFAVIEGRKFKNGPNEVGNGNGDIPPDEAILLGDRQNDFLESWIQDWAFADMKAVLIESIMTQNHTHAGNGNEFNPIVADPDANGWPPVARNESMRIIRKAFPVMIGGDNHLPTLCHLGVDDFEDAFIGFSTPATAVGFPRKWDPANDVATRNTKVAGFPEYAAENFAVNPTFNGFPYLGRYTSDHGHPQTIVAIANPELWLGQGVFGDPEYLRLKSSGTGVTTFNKQTRQITFKAYPITADFSAAEPEQYADWPLTVEQSDNYGRAIAGFLAPINDPAFEFPVVEVIDENSGELVYAVRAWEECFRPRVFEDSIYTVRYGAPETNTWVELNGQEIVMPGDVNRDGAVNLLDVMPFVDVISNGEYLPEADVNNDCLVNLLDVAVFVDLLSGG